MDMWTRETVVPWYCGSVDIWVRGDVGTWTCGSEETCIGGHVGPWRREPVDVQVREIYGTAVCNCLQPFAAMCSRLQLSAAVVCSRLQQFSAVGRRLQPFTAVCSRFQLFAPVYRGSVAHWGGASIASGGGCP